MKEAIEIVNKYLHYAYYNLEVAMNAYNLDPCKDTYARVKYFYGQIEGLEAIRREFKKSLDFLQIPYC